MKNNLMFLLLNAVKQQLSHKLIEKLTAGVSWTFTTSNVGAM